MADVLAVGDRVLVEVERGWSEYATVVALAGPMATVELDETIELPERCGGGWMLVVDREVDELERAPHG